MIEHLTFHEVIDQIGTALMELSGVELAEIAEKYIDDVEFEYHGDGTFTKKYLIKESEKILSKSI